MNKKLMSIIMAGIISVSALSQIFAVNSSAYSRYERIAGANRYLTSDLVSARNKSKIVVLASGESFPDALSAVNISNKYDAATILTNGTNPSIINILKNRGAEKIFLIGGVSSISNELENKIRNAGFSVERIGGINRYETSRNTLKRAGYTSVGVASGKDYPDALAASALLKQENCGLLLVDGNRPYEVPKGTTVKYTFGGSRTIVQNGGERIHGVSRFETAVKISNLVNNPRTMAVVSGDNFADALSATNLVVSADAIIMPVQKYPYYDVIRKARQVDDVIFVGGLNSISSDTAARIIEKGFEGANKPSAGDDYNTSKLTSEQKTFLSDLETTGNKIVDDIESMERLMDAIKGLNLPSPEQSIENINQFKEILDKMNLDKTAKDILKDIQKLQSLIDKIKKAGDMSPDQYRPLIKAMVDKIKAQVNEFNKAIDKILNNVADAAVKYAMEQVKQLINKALEDLLKQVVGI